MAKSYEPDSHGLVDVAQSKQMQAAMVGIATSGLSGARAIAPVDTGEYRNSFRVVPTTTKAGWRNENRAAARIEANVPYASAVERKHHVLSKVASIIEGGR